MWCSRGCVAPPAISDACLWHVSIAGGARRRGCAAAGVPVFFNGLLGPTAVGSLLVIENVVLVDEADAPLGAGEKQAVHVAGELHRAFSVFAFNAAGEL